MASHQSASSSAGPRDGAIGEGALKDMLEDMWKERHEWESKGDDDDLWYYK